VKGASSLGTLHYVPVVPPPTATTTDATATKAVVLPPTAATTDGTATQVALPPPAAATTDENANQFHAPYQQLPPLMRIRHNLFPKEMLQWVLSAIFCKTFQMQFPKVLYLISIYLFWNWLQS